MRVPADPLAFTTRRYSRHLPRIDSPVIAYGVISMPLSVYAHPITRIIDASTSDLPIRQPELIIGYAVMLSVAPVDERA